MDLATADHTLDYWLVIGLAALALPVLHRLWNGPSTGDRVLALETIGALGVLILVAFSLIAGRLIYLDLAVLLALFSFLGTLVIARYMERDLLD